MADPAVVNAAPRSVDTLLAEIAVLPVAGSGDPFTSRNHDQFLYGAKSQSMADYTQLQGQYLAFIHYYTKVNGRPPAEADMQRYFRTTPPTVHQMVLKLAERGFVQRTPGQPRSIRVLLPREQLPDLE